MENLYYLIPFFIILVCAMPVFLTFKVSYNLLKNRGAVGLFIFGIKIKSFMFYFSDMSVKIYNEKQFVEQEINFESKEAVIAEKLIEQIKAKTKLKLLQVNYNIGLSDAFQTALVCGVINQALLTFFTRLKCSKPTASLLLADNASYNETVFETAVTLKISISLFDLVYSFINSVILSVKEAQ